MATIDIFSKINLPSEKVFKYFLNPGVILRCSSPFFKIENFNFNNTNIDLNTYYSQRCVFWDTLQLLYQIKEIIPNKKISSSFSGLIKGTQSVYFLEEENNCLIREKLDLSLFNQFNPSALDLLLSTFFYIDTYIKHLRLKNILCKDFKLQKKYPLKEWSSIRSYIVVNARLEEMVSLLSDVDKFALWVSPFLNIESSKKTKDNKKEFEASFTLLPFLPSFKCIIDKKDSNKISISLSSLILKGKNIWNIMPCENEFVIENIIEVDELLKYFEIAWFIIGNTLVKLELNNWNKRLKDIVEKTNLVRRLELSLKQA
ncbi:MAG: hypothetical protein HYY52_08385 [Candidatus Melainabacteria bacterium]|nr:hypothetical protein [Candidatus Melainabacteria bacterium]